jgi:hypothetical protein
MTVAQIACLVTGWIAAMFSGALLASAGTEDNVWYDNGTVFGVCVTLSIVLIVIAVIR